MRSLGFIVGIIIGTLCCDAAGAWGAEGHKTVGALAGKLIEGTRAGTEVRTLLGDLTLADAAIWADCVKGVNAELVYANPGKFPECAIFETPQGQAEMIDFVKRNLKACDPKPGEEDCHRQYHYTDVNPPQPQYKLGLVGTREEDVVGAIGATIRVLQGQPAPAPFNIKDRREALLMLVHYVGDIHQPMHVGSLYLSNAGDRLNPDKSGLQPSSETHGANALVVKEVDQTRKLHAIWDNIARSQHMDRIDAAWLAKAKAVPPTGTDPTKFAAVWANESLRQSREAFRLVTFAPSDGKQWPAKLPSDYPARMALVKKAQLTAAGAHLAEVLKLVWP